MNKNSLEKYKQELAKEELRKAAFCAMKESVDKYKRDLENYNQELRSAGFSSRISGSMITKPLDDLVNDLSKDSDGLLNLANRNGVAQNVITPTPVALSFAARYIDSTTTCYMVNPFVYGNKPGVCTAFMCDDLCVVPSENTYKTEW